MNGFVLVVDGDSKILKRLKKSEVIITTESLLKAPDLYRAWNSDNHVFCIQVRENMSLSDLEINGNIKEIPISLHVPGAGNLRKIFLTASQYRHSNLRIFMPAENSRNIRDLQIMSSIGIYCGLYINDDEHLADWERINDLMYYSVYSRASHTPIEPFKYTVEHFDAGNCSYFSTPYFDNPTRFLHIDDDENIALSAKSLTEGKYISTGIETINSIRENEEFKQQTKDWKPFLESKSCAYCSAWRICLGEYSASCERTGNAQKFFEDLLEAASKRSGQRKGGVWQL